MMVRRIINTAGVVGLVTLIAVSILPGCYYDVEENLIVRDTTYVYDTTGGGGGCDTTPCHIPRILHRCLRSIATCAIVRPHS